MASYLRRVRTTIHQSRNSNKQHKPANHLDSHTIDLSTAIESPLSVSTRHSFYQEKHSAFDSASSVTELRRRLARKASTISLRTKSRKGEKLRTRKSLLLASNETYSELSADEEKRQLVQQHRPLTPPLPLPKPAIYELPASGERTSRTITTQRNFSLPLHQKQERGAQAGLGSWVKMSAEASPPPVSFVKLKEIATTACSTTLSQASSYLHSETENWNTTIINSILSALVRETTLPPASQPQWKYVVNSTIIQHAVASTDEKAKTGRRGMHSASGAYWNNEKDGMWSFKYEAAEKKGLDVVVGVIWIWVG